MTKSGKTRVMVVDDHAAVRDGFTAFLDAFDDLVLVATASSGVEALYFCSWFQPDVVLMDLMTTDPDGVTTTRLIRQLYSDIQVIAMTDFEDKSLMDDALKAGAVSFLHKGLSAGELAGAIRDAHPCQPVSSRPNGTDTIN